MIELYELLRDAMLMVGVGLSQDDRRVLLRKLDRAHDLIVAGISTVPRYEKNEGSAVVREKQ